MNRWLLVVLFILGGMNAFAQNINIDIRRNWYAQVPRLEMDMIDTLVLVPDQPAKDPDKPLFLWQYNPGDIYQILVLYNPTPGLEPIFPREKWRLLQTGRNDYELIIKNNDPRKLLHTKLRRYKLYQVRDNYQILQKMVLVRK